MGKKMTKSRSEKRIQGEREEKKWGAYEVRNPKGPEEKYTTNRKRGALNVKTLKNKWIRSRVVLDSTGIQTWSELHVAWAKNKKRNSFWSLK